ncbi:MAG TPA: hypothetical protein VLB09_07525, partial [Nitrospiria bacterium]|nr:hypothetical protein [Nitrospiria bacterium]
QTRSMEAECTMRTKETTTGLRIFCENVAWDGDQAIKALLEGAPGLMSQPAFTVNSEGVITGIEGLEDIRKAMEPVLEKAKALPAVAREQIENLLAPETLSDIFANEWSNLAPFWHGAELETGSWYELRQSFPLPVSGDMIEWTQEFILAGRVPCDRKDSGMNCVKLILVSKPDKDQFGEAIDRMTKKLVPREPGGSTAPGLIIREVEYKYTLVTLPDRLLPYWVEDSRFIQMEAKGAGGETVTMDALDERKHLYEYTTIP